jgi:hypothetical protein
MKSSRWEQHGDAMVYTPISILLNGSRITSPVIQGGLYNAVGTGAFGPFAITFPTAFNTVPIVVAWTGLSTLGNFTTLVFTLINATGVTVSIEKFIPGQAALAAGENANVEWIAIGS